ncbi:MAG: histidine phosphatase family protein [Rhodobacteraceae bacterium]|nr:histidine phosphatase family protein [Paracoccaceae bacterium]
MIDRLPFYFLRHGETDWNRLHLMQGQTDTPLNPHGVVQSEAAAQYLSSRKITAVCTSPLRRARSTAELISARVNAPLVVINDLRECNYGTYEGHPSGPWREDWFKGAPIPEGELFDDFLERSVRGINAALAYRGRVLIVAHGGTFWAIRRYALDGAQLKAGNCELMALAPPGDDGGPWNCKRLFMADTSIDADAAVG